MRRLLRLLPVVVACSTARADEAYDRWREPEKVMAALAVRPGQRVADIGAGSGYFTLRLADAVGDKGLVVATDVDDRALTVLYALAAGRRNVVVRKVAADDPGLEARRFDLVLLAQVDHYLPDRVAYLRRLRPALARGGRIAVLNRLPFREPLIAAAREAGYTVRAGPGELASHFLVFLSPRR